MPSPKLVPLVLSDAERASLEALSRKRTASQSLARRARILTPTERHWLKSAEILARLGAGKEYDARKLRDLAFDTLIALSARDAGATLITCNREDFAEIGNYLSFKVAFW